MKCYGACYGELASRNMLRNISIYGAAVQRDEAKRNRAAAWLDAAEKSTARKAGELASRNMLRNISIYGAAVQRDGAKRNRAAAWLDRENSSYFSLYGAYFRMTASATFIPSIAADVMPPAYPAPSPHG